MTTSLLRLLEQAHPERDQADLLAMLDAIPDRKAAHAPQKPVQRLSAPGSLYPLRKPQRPPLRPLAIARRRRLAASGPLPPSLAARFTTGELAVMRIVADECRDKGSCERTLAEIAARAGVCRKLAKNAIRMATRMGLLSVEIRRRPGRKNLPNVVRVIDKEWLTWIRRGPRQEFRGNLPRNPKAAAQCIGGKKLAPTDTRIQQEPRRASKTHRAAERQRQTV